MRQLEGSKLEGLEVETFDPSYLPIPQTLPQRTRHVARDRGAF